MALLVGAAMIPVYVHELSRHDESIMDFYQEWASARNFLEGLPVYSSHRVTIPRYLGKQDPDAGDLFIEVNAHPPTSILLAVPLGMLSYPQAMCVWNLLSLVMLAASLILVRGGLRIPLTAWSLFPSLTLILLCFPLLMHIHFGQLTLLILLLLTGAWSADRTGRGRLAGILLGTAVTIKVFPVALFIYFAARRRWDTIVTGVVSVASITLLTGLLLGFDNYVYYVHYVIPRVAKYRGIWFNLSLPGFWTKLFDPPSDYPFVQPLVRSPALALAATSLSCALVLIAAWWFSMRARTRAGLDLAFGLTLTGMLLVSPVTWDHYLLLLLVPLAVAWVNLPRSASARLLFTGIVVAVWTWPYVVFDLTIPGGVTRGTAGPLHTLGVGSYQCYALIALFALQIAELREAESSRA